MLIYIANGVGIVAVALFVLSYLQKTRRSILICNVISRILYVVQYFLLFAFSGAVLDILGVGASVLAQKKDTPFIKKHLPVFVIATNIVIVAAGILLYENIYSLLPMFGVLLHTGAFWLSDEKKIRIVSLLGSPFWLVYNFVMMAYGSAVGDVLTIISISTAIVRYDILKKEKSNLKD